MLCSILLLLTINAVTCTLKLSTDSITLNVGESTIFQLNTNNEQGRNVSNNTLSFVPEHDDIIEVSPTTVLVRFSTNITNSTYNISVVAIKAGISGVVVTIDPPDAFSKAPLFLLVHVCRGNILQLLSSIAGWLYFLAWSLYYYPQMYTNYKRKSVVGLNFDHLLFGVFGYMVYSVFNLGLFFTPAIQEQYFQRYTRSILPVEPNDLFASSHNFLAYSFTIIQCFLYEKGNQKVSITARMIIGVYILLIVVFVILACLHILLWLDVLYLCSYVKLCISLTFHIPQVYMIYKRKSIKGWNIGGSMLNIFGGFMSISQMLLNGYNYADWKTVLENPTKFGMGIFSMGFSTIFIVQYFILYPPEK